MKKVSLFFLISLYFLFSSVGCSQYNFNHSYGTPDNVFSQFLERENFVSGVSQGEFKEQLNDYRYEGTPITDIVHGFFIDGEWGGGYYASCDLFGFCNDYKAENGNVNYTNQFWTKTPLDGLQLPYNIGFDDSLTKILRKIGIETEPYDNFTADASAQTDMTLFSKGNTKLILRDPSRAEKPTEHEMPLLLIYSETCQTTRGDGIPVTVERIVTMSFEKKLSSKNDTLEKFAMSVTEVYQRYCINTNQILAFRE